MQTTFAHATVAEAARKGDAAVLAALPPADLARALAAVDEDERCVCVVVVVVVGGGG